VDQFLAKEHSSSSLTFLPVKSEIEIDYKLGYMARLLETLSGTL